MRNFLFMFGERSSSKCHTLDRRLNAKFHVQSYFSSPSSLINDQAKSSCIRCSKLSTVYRVVENYPANDTEKPGNGKQVEPFKWFDEISIAHSKRKCLPRIKKKRWTTRNFSLQSDAKFITPSVFFLATVHCYCCCHLWKEIFYVLLTNPGVGYWNCKSFWFNSIIWITRQEKQIRWERWTNIFHKRNFEILYSDVNRNSERYFLVSSSFIQSKRNNEIN